MSFCVKLPSNRKKKGKDDKQPKHLSDRTEKRSVSMTELMEQGRLVLREVTFPEHTHAFYRKSYHHYCFPQLLTLHSYACVLIKNLEGFFVWLVGFCVRDF